MREDSLFAKFRRKNGVLLGGPIDEIIGADNYHPIRSNDLSGYYGSKLEKMRVLVAIQDTVFEEPERFVGRSYYQILTLRDFVNKISCEVNGFELNSAQTTDVVNRVVEMAMGREWRIKKEHG